MSEPSLFDALDEPERSCRPTDSPWRECSLTDFMRMSEREQLDYCARRDEDSARFAIDEQDASWYTQRATWYRERIAQLDKEA